MFLCVIQREIIHKTNLYMASLRILFINKMRPLSSRDKDSIRVGRALDSRGWSPSQIRSCRARNWSRTSWKCLGHPPGLTRREKLWLIWIWGPRRLSVAIRNIWGSSQCNRGSNKIILFEIFKIFLGFWFELMFIYNYNFSSYWGFWGRFGGVLRGWGLDYGAL